MRVVPNSGGVVESGLVLAAGLLSDSDTEHTLGYTPSTGKTDQPLDKLLCSLPNSKPRLTPVADSNAESHLGGRLHILSLEAFRRIGEFKTHRLTLGKRFVSVLDNL